MCPKTAAGIKSTDGVFFAEETKATKAEFWKLTFCHNLCLSLLLMVGICFLGQSYSVL